GVIALNAAESHEIAQKPYRSAARSAYHGERAEASDHSLDHHKDHYRRNRHLARIHYSLYRRAQERAEQSPDVAERCLCLRLIRASGIASVHMRRASCVFPRLARPLLLRLFSLSCVLLLCLLSGLLLRFCRLLIFRFLSLACSLTLAPLCNAHSTGAHLAFF